MGITLRPFTNMIITVVTLADMATTMAGYGNSDRYRGGPIDGISTEAFHDGRKGYCSFCWSFLKLMKVTSAGFPSVVAQKLFLATFWSA